MLNLGDTMPNIKADSTIGPIELFEYFGSDWGILFSHPKDFTPVCTTELGRLAQLAESFEKRGVKIVGLSVDTVQDHKEWTKDIEAYAKATVKFPLLADPNGDIARSLGLLDKDSADTLTVRGVFIVSPNRKIRATICYPTSAGRNFDEILRVVDSLQFTDARPDTVTPVGWKSGDEVIVKPGCPSTADTKVLQVPSGKEYLRFTK